MADHRHRGHGEVVLMAEDESWEKYGFPNPYFHLGRLPFVGICKAYTERFKAINPQSGDYSVPDYFSKIDPG